MAPRVKGMTRISERWLLSVTRFGPPCVSEDQLLVSINLDRSTQRAHEFQLLFIRSD